MRNIGSTDLAVSPLCLGGNVFGWTADRDDSFAVLDAYTEAGGNFIDTADVYSAWAPGNRGGESETIIGEWLARSGRRDEMVIATKVGGMSGLADLRPDTIRTAIEDSLRRLGVDHIDLYWAHYDDPKTPIADTLEAFGELIAAGKVRYVGASNFSVDRVAESLRIADEEGLARYVALQPEYNLVERGYEAAMRDVAIRGGLSCVPYQGLAGGFLTGKYWPGVAVDSARARGAKKYLTTERGPRTLDVLGDIAAARGIEMSAVALAWLAARPTVVAPIASARTLDQLPGLLAFEDLTLDEKEIERLTEASDPG